MSSPSDLNARFVQTGLLQREGADTSESFLLLAEDARRRVPDEPGAAEIACRSYANAALQSLRFDHMARAATAIAGLRSLARAAGLRQQEAVAALLQGLHRFQAGHHGEAFDELVKLAGSRLGRELTLQPRLLMLRWLAMMCLPVDPGDSVDLCIALAHAAWVGQPGTLPDAWLLAEGQLRLQQYLWSDAAFEGRLRRPEMPPARREGLLHDAQRCLKAGTRLALKESADRQNQLVGRLHLCVVEGLLARSPARVLQALETMKELPSEAHHAGMRDEVASALVLLKDFEGAIRVLDALAPTAPPHARWDEALDNLHLRAVVAAGLGDTPQAMATYRRYAVGMAEQMGRMELHAHKALRQLSRLPGARPEDLPGVAPAYLARAIDLLQHDTRQNDVTRLARAVGVSERTLRSAFQVHLGKAPKAYIRDLRLDAAKAHLEGSAAARPTVSELAERFGFSHPGRFAAAYRTRHGLSPGTRTE